LLGLYRRLAVWVEPTLLQPAVCRDPDDDWVLATALAGEAEAIVSGDEDPLILGEHAGIAILSPRRFLELVQRPT
jgi:predicted nucleic acid-binding protein